jgi:toxin ParE1/3/4
MEETKKLQVKISRQFNIDLDEIFQYGAETFGFKQAEKYEKEIWQFVEALSHNYLLYPMCRHIPTKSKMYRWIILDAHVIIYRITKTEVQVLRIIHSKRSITRIRSARSIKI